MSRLATNRTTPAARPPLRLLPPAVPRSRTDSRRRRLARLHLFTYVVGNAIFWLLWAAIAVSTDRWYWWPVVPMAAWAGVLAVHLWHTREFLAGR